MRIPLAFTLVVTAACASQPAPPSGPSDSNGLSGSSGSSDPSNVFAPDTTTVTIHLAGGLGPAPGAGSTCFPDLEDYTYVIATATLSWSVCTAPTPGGVYHLLPGQATLTAMQVNDLLTALHALEAPDLPANEACGGDFQEVFTFASPTGTKTYSTADCLEGDTAVLDAIYAVTQ
jgi:hypothetical protein